MRWKKVTGAEILAWQIEDRWWPTPKLLRAAACEAKEDR